MRYLFSSVGAKLKNLRYAPTSGFKSSVRIPVSCCPERCDWQISSERFIKTLTTCNSHFPNDQLVALHFLVKGRQMSPLWRLWQSYAKKVLWGILSDIFHCLFNDIFMFFFRQCLLLLIHHPYPSWNDNWKKPCRDLMDSGEKSKNVTSHNFLSDISQ